MSPRGPPRPDVGEDASHPRAGSTGERRLPRGDSADELRLHQPAGGGSRRQPCRGSRARVPAPDGSPGWQLADRHEPRHVAHHARVNALQDRLPETDREAITAWLLRQQYRGVHPYTGAAPGGWAWTDLPGGVPDADDTAGALVALYALGRRTRRRHRGGDRWESAGCSICRIATAASRRSAADGERCPFDRSSNDITAHALLAWSTWRPHVGADDKRRVDAAVERAGRFLERTQRPDGAWTPLWFGNQRARRRGEPRLRHGARPARDAPRPAGLARAGAGRRLAPLRAECRRRLGRRPRSAVEHRGNVARRGGAGGLARGRGVPTRSVAGRRGSTRRPRAASGRPLRPSGCTSRGCGTTSRSTR